MAKCLIKTIKHGIIVLSATPNNVDCWDEQLAEVMFGYRCGIKVSIKFSLLMILIGRTSHLKANNYLHSLIAVIDDIVDVETTAE
jgi:hypothetical protein